MVQQENEKKEMEIEMNKMKIIIDKLKLKSIDERRYKEWTTEQVIIWIISLNNGKYKQYKNILTKELTKQNVTGSHLQYIEKNGLLSFGINDFMDRQILYKSIQKLIHKHNDNQGNNQNDYEPTAYI